MGYTCLSLELLQSFADSKVRIQVYTREKRKQRENSMMDSLRRLRRPPADSSKALEAKVSLESGEIRLDSEEIIPVESEGEEEDEELETIAFLHFREEYYRQRNPL